MSAQSRRSKAYKNGYFCKGSIVAGSIMGCRWTSTNGFYLFFFLLLRLLVFHKGGKQRSVVLGCCHSEGRHRG